jgi:putative sterol carrier protein
MRKKVRAVGIRTTPDVVDGSVRDADGSKLRTNQGGEVAVRFRSRSANDRALAADAFELFGDFISDLEGVDSDVRADGDEELGWRMRKRTKRVRNDPRHRTAPTRVDGCHVAALRVPNEHRNAVGSASGDRKSRVAREQGVAFAVGDRSYVARARNGLHPDTMNLSLFEKAICIHTELMRETLAVRGHGGIVVPEMKTQVERVVGRRTHPTPPRRERVTKAVLLENGGTDGTHSVCRSTASLREPRGQAKSCVLQARAGSWQVHRFPSFEWTQALKIALNTDRRYREEGKAWTFGSIAMIVLADRTHGLELDAGIVLDVHQGQCRDARFVEGVSDPDDAEFVIVGSYARWRDVIEGRLDPIKGMMEGKLKLSRGHLPTIVRFVETSRRIVSSASRVPTWFPDA